MARGKPLTREALAAVGADVLAEVLIAHAGTDPVLRKKLGMLLAGIEGTDRLAAEIDKRVRTIGRSRSFVSWEQKKPLLHELDHLRQTIVTGLAGQHRERAIELLWSLIGIAAAVTDRMRALLVSGAISVINAAMRPGSRQMTDWLRALLLRKPRKLVAVALANKMARIAWAMMKSGETYRRSPAAAGAVAA